jgi:hypothetical protein
MSAAETDSKLLLFWLRILQEGEGMIAAFEADHVGAPPITLAAPLDGRTRDAWIELWKEITAMIVIFEEEFGAGTPDDAEPNGYSMIHSAAISGRFASSELHRCARSPTSAADDPPAKCLGRRPGR